MTYLNPPIVKMTKPGFIAIYSQESSGLHGLNSDVWDVYQLVGKSIVENIQKVTETSIIKGLKQSPIDILQNDPIMIAVDEVNRNSAEYEKDILKTIKYAITNDSSIEVDEDEINIYASLISNMPITELIKAVNVVSSNVYDVVIDLLSDVKEGSGSGKRPKFCKRDIGKLNKLQKLIDEDMLLISHIPSCVACHLQSGGNVGNVNESSVSKISSAVHQQSSNESVFTYPKVASTVGDSETDKSMMGNSEFTVSITPYH